MALKSFDINTNQVAALTNVMRELTSIRAALENSPIHGR